MSNRGGLRLGFGGKRTKRAAKKSEGTHLTPRKDEPLTVRCAKSLAEALSEQSDDVEEWGAVVCSWPAAALERVLPLLPARVLLRLHAAFGGISPAAHDVLGDGAVLERAIQRDEKRENGLVDVFAGDAAGAPWTAQPPRGVAPEQLLFHQPHKPDVGSRATCDDIDAFRRAFDVFSGGLLRGLDFKKLGLVAAGGSILACVSPRPEKADDDLVGWLEPRPVSVVPGRHHVESDARTLIRDQEASPFCTSSDVDLFLVGCDEQRAFDALRAVHETVLRNACCRVACVRSASALTVSAGFPRRHAQVVLRLYASPAAVLASFDVDACCFVYDGERVLASARGLRALIERTNRVDPARRSLTYESRLIKYALRGFSVFVPPRLYKPSAVDPRVYDLCLALREHHPRCLAATPKTPETPAGRRLLAAAALRRTRDPVFGDGGEKPSGLVRLLVASRLYALRNAADAEVTQTKKKKGVDATTSLRDVLRRGWCYNRQKTPPMLPDEPRTFYSSQGPCRTEGDFTAEDEALETGGEQDSTPGQPLYRCSLPWKPGWDAARILSFVRARDEAAAQAERMREDGEHEWAPPRVRAVAQRSGGTLPSEYVASASFAFDDVVHVSALRWKAPSRSFYPVPIEGFSDSAHLSEGDPQQFYKCVIQSVGHEWPADDKPTHYVKTRPSNIHHAQQMSYADFANLGLLPTASYVGGEHATARVFEPGVVVRAALTDVEAGAVKVFRAAARALAQSPAPVVDNLETWAAPATNGVQGSGIPVDAETLLGADETHLHALKDMPAPIKTRINSALRKRCAGIASRIVKDLPGGGPAKDEELKKRHAELVKTQEGYDGTRTWSEAHRRIVRKTSLEIVETLDADARRALAAPIFDAYVDLTFAFEAVALKTGAQVVGVCARCAAVLTSNRKCARCKVANYCSRDCQARHWDTHKATCRKADAPPRPPAPPGGAPIVQAVGRAANLEGAGAAAMNDLETQMQGLAQILREGGAGAADMRRAVADVPQAG